MRISAPIVVVAGVAALASACPKESGEGEGEGEGDVETPDAGTPADASCSHAVIDCGESPLDCDARTLNAGIAAAKGVGDDDCTAIADAFETLLSCEAGASCDQLLEGSACPSEGDAVDTIADRGALACFDGDPPLEIPGAWICLGRFYAAKDGCDCSCGAVDPDCGGGAACVDVGCNAAGCAYCYASAADAADGVTGVQNGAACDPP